MYRHGDLYMYILFLQKGFLSSRREKKKKAFFWRWPSMTGMKYKFNQSNVDFLFLMVVCSFVFIESSEYWVMSDYSSHPPACKNASNEVRPPVPERN